MASDPALRDALEAAGEAVRMRARFSPLTGMALSHDFAGAAIAAFLRALPELSASEYVAGFPIRRVNVPASLWDNLAAAVEAAAKEPGHE